MLRPGSVIIDLVAGGVYGDLDHCPIKDLLESAQELLSLMPRVKSPGMWGIGKCYDASCMVFTTEREFPIPQALKLEVFEGQPAGNWLFRLVPMLWDRDRYWRFNDYQRPIGKVVDGKVVPDTNGIPVRYHQGVHGELQRAEAARHRQLTLTF